MRSYATDPNVLAEKLGLSPQERDVLLEASEHPGSCTCDLCREWWLKMGPDPDTNEYGPFGLFGPSTDEQLEAEEHPPLCTCDACRRWWMLMGPDPVTKEYGPFGPSI